MSAKYYCLCVFSAVVLFSSASYGDTNVLTNPGFESGDTSGWSARGCPIEVVTSPVHSGSYSARAYNRTAGWQGIQQNLMGVIVEGQTYLISGYVMIENVPDANVHCVVQQTVDGATTYNWVANVVCNNSGWTQLWGGFTPNSAGGTLTTLLVYFESDTGVNFYVDDAVVYGPVPGPPVPVDPNATGEVDTTIRHQVIEGFGASGAWYENWLTSYQDSNQLYDLLFDELGIDIYRLRNTYDQNTNGAAYMANSGQIVSAAK